ncbi:MAG: hypothetical protein OES24_17580 [Acidimicrobiia bacterium]|nr:hypothetical protein [Acidimicrobiia bacterium]
MASLGSDTFDFWLGEWDCAFEGGHAVNSVTRRFGGKVIQENFAVDQPRIWNGMSVSVFDESVGWRQTWVDESGSYWAFEGGLVDGHPSFGTPVPVDAEGVYKRMVFTDIGPDGFHWRWESSPDGGDWAVNWEIDYTRRAGDSIA